MQKFEITVFVSSGNELVFVFENVVDGSGSMPDQSYKRLTMSQIHVSASWL
jgi:hypothetical protein